MLTSNAVSQRGVVFFRSQDNLTDDLQKELVDRLGKLSGKPATSGLHIHPISNAARDHGGKDNEISVISSEQAKKLYSNRFENSFTGGKFRQSGRNQWHSDITFEPVPSDYALLRLTQLPKTGGGKQMSPRHTVWRGLAANLCRHSLGLRIRALRPHFAPSPTLPR